MTAKKIFKKYKYDIALEEGVGAHLVAWVTGLVVFFVTLALAVNFGLSSMTKSWVTGLEGSLTVEIKPPLSASAEEQALQDDAVKKVLWLAKQHPAVAESRALSKEEVRALIEPWLGSNNALDGIPLPALIDIKLNAGANIVKLQGDIRALVPAASVDSHTDTLDDVKALVNTAKTFVLLLTCVIVLLAVTAIAGIVRSKFAIHRQEVETLHLIGASDEYIARQFRRHTLKGTLRGALFGLGCMMVTLAAIGAATHAIDASVFPNIRLEPWQWAALILSPLVAGSLIAHMTAQTAVMKELARMP